MLLALGSALAVLLLGFRLNESWKVLWLVHSHWFDGDVSSFDFSDFFLFLVDSLNINFYKSSPLKDL